MEGIGEALKYLHEGKEVFQEVKQYLPQFLQNPFGNKRALEDPLEHVFQNPRKQFQQSVVGSFTGYRGSVRSRISPHWRAAFRQRNYRPKRRSFYRSSYRKPVYRYLKRGRYPYRRTFKRRNAVQTV